MHRDELSPEFEALEAEIDDLHRGLAESNAQFAALVAQTAQARAEYSGENHDAVRSAREAVQRDHAAIEALKARRRDRKARSASRRRPVVCAQSQARPQASRPRERREVRHQARTTSSGDSGDDGPEPPQPAPCRRWGS